MRRMLGIVPVVVALIGPSAVGSVATRASAAASADEVVFRDSCVGNVVAMHPDGTGRRTVPAPGVPLVDVSTASPSMTALFMGRTAWGEPFKIWAVSFARDATGDVAASAPVELVTAPDGQLYGTYATFAPGGDHVAFVGGTAGTTLYEGDVVRDAGAVTGMANVHAIVDLGTLGSPSDTPTSTAVLGIDYAQDGSRLIATIYDDLWMLQLGPDRTFVSARPLTRTPAFAEMTPQWSPAGDVVAYVGAPIARMTTGAYGYSADQSLYVRDVQTSAVRTLLARTKQVWPSAPTWSPDGSMLLYSARGDSAYGTRSAPCGGMTNYDLFRLAADGSGKPINITKTAGTSVEQRPFWGW